MESQDPNTTPDKLLPLVPLDPETAELEALDDVIFPAIEGDPTALEATPRVWQTAVEKLGRERVEESRHEYLRYARATWKALRRQATKDPLRLVAVLKIILMLIGDGA